MPSGAVNNVNMQPDGSTTFAEVDLPAGDSTTPPNTSRIRWVKLASGAVVAEAYAYDSLGLGQGALQVRAYGSGPGGGTGQVKINADHTSARGAQLLVQAGSGDADPNQSKVWARAVGRNGFSDQIVTLIDGLGGSDFVRYIGAFRALGAGPTSQVFTVPGDTTRNTTCLAIFGGTCFTTLAGNFCALDHVVDGVTKDNAFIYGNNVEHLTVFGVTTYALAGGPHTFTVQNSAGFVNSATNASDAQMLAVFAIN